MNMRVLVILLVGVVAGQAVAEEASKSGETLEDDLEMMSKANYDKLKDLSNSVSRLTDKVTKLARQTMLQQFFVEERIRSEGDSGIKLVRGQDKGPANYYENTHIGNAVAAIHDHSNFESLMGMGEVIAVLNGVEFRTRHNDYNLVMPSTTSTGYNAVEYIPFPEPPEEVTSKKDINEQIEEMRQWFKAFKDQDPSVRDYRKYFKPVLCYMEGAWTLDTKALEEPFASKRHKIDATSWFQLQDRVRYASYTGTKSRLENYAYLPTTIISVNESTGYVTYGQWNYRILCHPIKQDIRTSYLKQVEDLSYRYPRGWNRELVKARRSARFRLDEHDTPQPTQYSLLDEIFYSIPGKDNIPGNLTQDGLGDTLHSLVSPTPLNAGYYHRWYKVAKPGPMGVTNAARGFNDANLWVAQTTQPRIAPMSVHACRSWKGPGKKFTKACGIQEARYSYAIPLEIVFMTPLLSWNPYNITKNSRTKALANGRNGSPEKPLDGVFKDLFYYRTPQEFFKGKVDKSDRADTVRGAVYVLDANGKARSVASSGTQIVMREIEGVGKVRLRYPIAPVHGEGSSAWKELNALRDMTLKEVERPKEPLPESVSLSMIASKDDQSAVHTHNMTVSWKDFISMLVDHKEVEVLTTMGGSHQHSLKIHYNVDQKRFEYITCDGKNVCQDLHPKKLHIITKSEYINVALPKDYTG